MESQSATQSRPHLENQRRSNQRQCGSSWTWSSDPSNTQFSHAQPKLYEVLPDSTGAERIQPPHSVTAVMWSYLPLVFAVCLHTKDPEGQVGLSWVTSEFLFDSPWCEKIKFILHFLHQQGKSVRDSDSGSSDSDSDSYTLTVVQQLPELPHLK